jgi:DNA-directed RNA polymerase subunit RPC12/RpoP
MSEVLKCESCGAINLLPANKTSMFCSHCGTPIAVKVVTSQKDGSLIKVKPKIVDGELSLKSRKLKSFHDIIVWFSDSELETIEALILDDNNISSLEGFERFRSVYNLSLSSNSFTDLTDSDITILNDRQLRGSKCGFELDLHQNEFSSTEWLKKIDFQKILNTYKGKLTFRGLDTPFYETDYSLVCIRIHGDFDGVDEFHNQSSYNPKNKKETEAKNNSINNTSDKSSLGKCFIATATLGSYDHPEVIELRKFRDQWILTKTWGKGFVNCYYHYGAKAAMAIESYLFLKKASYILIVKPLVILSRIILNQKKNNS